MNQLLRSMSISMYMDQILYSNYLKTGNENDDEKNIFNQ